MGDDWRNEPATALQKEKLQFFGCTWDGKITKGEASDAITQCIQQFPDKEQEWQNRPATAKQKRALREMGEDISPDLTYSDAKDAIEDSEDIPTTEENEKQALESRVEDHMLSMFTTWEYERKVSKKKVREAIQYLDKNKPGWDSTGDLIDVLESQESGSTGRRSSQGCLVMLAVCIFIVWFVVKTLAR